MMLKVIYIGIRLQKGVFKSLKQASVKVGLGISGDTLNVDPDRQISIYVRRAYKAIVDDKGGFCRTRFKPNLILETIEPLEIHVKDRLKAGSCELEITVAGKDCHALCPQFEEDSSCDIHRDIYFAKVVKNGEISLYDEVVKR